MKFTGHERDLHSPAGAGDDLHYMHARFHSPVTGRMLSPDTIGGDPWMPQSWNRYAYVLGNPMSFVDPFGLIECRPKHRDEFDKDVEAAKSKSCAAGIWRSIEALKIRALEQLPPDRA